MISLLSPRFLNIYKIKTNTTIMFHFLTSLLVIICLNAKLDCCLSDVFCFLQSVQSCLRLTVLSQCSWIKIIQSAPLIRCRLSLYHFLFGDPISRWVVALPAWSPPITLYRTAEACEQSTGRASSAFECWQFKPRGSLWRHMIFYSHSNLSLLYISHSLGIVTHLFFIHPFKINALSPQNNLTCGGLKILS